MVFQLCVCYFWRTGIRSKQENKKRDPQWLSETYVGLGWKNFLSIKEYQVTQNNGQASVDFISSLNIRINMQKELNAKNSLSFTLKYAFLAYVWGRVRHPLDIPNLIDIDKISQVSNNHNAIGLGNDVTIGDALRTGDFLTLNKLVQLDTQFEYRHSLSKKN